MAALAELLGSELIAKGGEKKDTATALADKGAVGIYFSAHWCPPCRGFTPKLAEWYTANLQAKGMEIVFISSDRDQGAFDEYFGEMPWLAVPFDQKDIKAKLDKKFKVQGIPTFVVLNPDGSILTKDGRAAVSNDPTGAEFPEGWRQLPPKEILKKITLKGREGITTVDQAVQGKKALALYFSAHWCPPCRGFTPQLAEWYKKDLQNKGLEVIFVSSDRDQGAFDEYFAEQPWLAMDFAERSLKGKLSDAFGIEGIPSLVVLDADLNTVTTEGRAAISSDPQGNEMPWHPKPVKNMKQGPGSINEVPIVFLFCETSFPEVKKALEEAMTPLAEPFLQKAKETDEDPELAFAIVTEAAGLGPRIRSMVGYPALPPQAHEHPLEKKEEGSGGGWGCDGCGQSGQGKERWRCSQGCDFDFCGDCYNKSQQAPVAANPRLALIDIPDNGGYYQGPEVADAAGAKSVIEAFLADYKDKKLERKQLG